MPTHHINVCICTYNRPQLLGHLLSRLDNQQTEDLFTYSIVVADNDCARSAEPVATAFSHNAHVPLTYCIEPQKNIALARNKAIQHAEGDFIAFIDDDEFPPDNWLCNLFKACIAYGAAGVLGPVNPYFESEPPQWVKKGKFFERPNHASGYKVALSEARTGNVLFRKGILSAAEAPFRSEFDSAGEDVDFFRRMMEKGCVFVWCDEAAVHEMVPPSRCNLRYLLRRALLRGSNFPKHPKHRIRNATKSLIAVPCYTLALPILAVMGQHLFIEYLIRLCDHVARLLAFVGLRLVTERQT